MTSDSHLGLCGANYFDLQRDYRARGFSGESHDMVILRICHRQRLLDGAEPSHWLSGPTPAAHMRYGPYTA